ncbi:uncharacterized protein RSE6_05279 [Rhynchosporium secalis]|uniref:Uncharacterized protein n=1 Tax=Rhynchosporium secalis TaxID=38038 RepID=A0A1E1M7F3_RHYSE|nr:uncharacterized protein RSE6_05279 [Rhynchosporium secalis]
MGMGQDIALTILAELVYLNGDHQIGDIRGRLHSWLVLLEFWALKGWLSGFAFKKRRLIISNLILNADKKFNRTQAKLRSRKVPKLPVTY